MSNDQIAATNDLVEVTPDEMEDLVYSRYITLSSHQADLLAARSDDENDLDDELWDAIFGMRREAETIGHFLTVAEDAGHDLGTLFPLIPGVSLTACKQAYASVVA